MNQKPETTASFALFTGGGSAGHVTPNIAIIKKMQTANWRVAYIGSENGIEKNIIPALKIPYYSIKTGKLRRYFSWQNFLDPFNVLIGIVQAIKICHNLKPTVVFSKGGFVAFPVVLAAWINRIPVIIHESDLTPGFANRLSFPFAKRVLLTFAETKKHFKNQTKIAVVGTPIRPELLQGNANNGRKLCHFNDGKPIILLMGGSLGADTLNKIIRAILPELLMKYQVIHLCGKNKVDPRYTNLAGYQQFEYINDELGDLFACADLVISRAGANSLYEIMALKKVNILIPLSKKASRGDQLMNAHYFQKQGLSEVIEEEDLSEKSLLSAIQKTFDEKVIIQQHLSTLVLPDSLQLIFAELQM